MQKKNIVFIAKSLDGFIADKNGNIDWLDMIPNPDQVDMGYNQLMTEIDAIVMGRSTFETVCGFGGEWPYTKQVFILSKTLKAIPEKLQNKASLLKGNPKGIVEKLNDQGFNKLYIDGGRTVQNFLMEDLIDELRITTIPILLGGGFPLFGELEKKMKFEHLKTEIYLEQIIQSHYQRKK